MKTLLRAVLTGFGLKIGADLYRAFKKQVCLVWEKEDEEKAEEEEDRKDFIEPKQHSGTDEE